MTTIFGEVTVTRYAYRRPGHPNLHPADRALNLPEERHSHGVRRLAATQAARGSFDDATDAVRSATVTTQCGFASMLRALRAVGEHENQNRSVSGSQTPHLDDAIQPPRWLRSEQ